MVKKVAVIGSFVVDLMARVPHFPEPGETVLGSFFQAGPGGKVSNQAIAAQRAGSNLAFSAMVGTDDFAEIALEAFQKEGISPEFVFQTTAAPTGAALISVDESTGQNKIAVVLGANSTFDADNLHTLENMLDGCEYLLLQLEINLDATVRLVDLAHERGIRVILNPAPVQAIPDELYRKLYLITPNEVETKFLTGICCENIENYACAAEVFFEKGVQNVILTLGEKGVYVHNREQGILIGTHNVPVIDTTGAGDAFNGGLLAGLGKGMTLQKAAAFGNVVSNLAVTK